MERGERERCRPPSREADASIPPSMDPLGVPPEAGSKATSPSLETSMLTALSYSQWVDVAGVDYSAEGLFLFVIYLLPPPFSKKSKSHKSYTKKNNNMWTATIGIC